MYQTREMNSYMGNYNPNKTPYKPNNMNYPYQHNNNDERFGFLGPFLLGGVVGGLAAPAFYGPRPIYPPYPPYSNTTVYYPTYPPYGPYYR